MLNTLSFDESPIYEGALGETIEMEAEFIRYIFENPPFVIAAFIDDTFEEFSVLGNVPFELKGGRKYRISGEIEESYNKYKEETVRQLRLKGIALLPPSGEFGIIRFLQSLKGLKSRAFILYETYKEDTLRIMREEPDRVAKDIRGISLAQALKFQEQLMEQEESSETLTFLLNIGLSLNEAETLVRSRGEEVKKKIEKNPYLLAERGDGWPGMKFPRVDRLAMEWGVDPRLRERMEAGVVYTFQRDGDFGHCYSDYDSTLSATTRLLSNNYLTFESADIEAVIDRLLLEDVLFYDADRLYLKSVFVKEQQLAKRIIDVAKATDWVKAFDPAEAIDEHLAKRGITLEVEQREGAIEAIRNKGDFIVVNGAAGTGKTFTADVILRLLINQYEEDNEDESEKHPAKVSVLAPTGKATKVLRKAFNYQYPAKTIHRALQPSDVGFVYNRNNPLDSNIFVIDETSMLDTYLAHALFDAIPDGSKVILLGDVRQLPAIGAGNVLADIIKSDIVPVATLKVPKRQAKGSSIYENATRILNHQIIEPDKKDTFWFKSSNAYQATQLALKLIRQIATYNEEEIQVLSPMRMGKAGTHLLNYLLQREWNNKNEDSNQLNHSFDVDGTTYRLYFRIGDKVMQTVNNPELSWVIKDKTGELVPDNDMAGTVVTNGEQGYILDIYDDQVRMKSGRKQKTTTIAVQYDEGIVLYRGNEKKDLDHAYAISIHKAQGSQWPVVFQLMDYNNHNRMLSNELFYTGYSRASERHVLIADEESVRLATNQRVATKRRTSLVDRIEEGGI